jgi:hypothetical protein
MLTLAEMERVDGINAHVRNWRSAPPADIEWLIDKVRELQLIVEDYEEMASQMMSMETKPVNTCVCKCQ